MLRILLHVFFAIIPFIVYISTTEQQSGELIFIASIGFCLVGMVTNFLAMPVIGFTFQFLYRRFWTKYNHRTRLPRYSNSKQFYSQIYSFFKNTSCLDEIEQYRATFDDNYTLYATLIVPLIRLNMKIDLVNKMEYDKLVAEFNVLPVMFGGNKQSRKRWKEIKSSQEVKKLIQENPIERNLNQPIVRDHINNDFV